MEKDVVKQLENENFKFKHSLGQNFITDTNLLKAIVLDANILPFDNVLEIGAGAGTLSNQIASKTSGTVVCVEVDNSLQPVLQNNLQNFNNVKIVFNDILKISPAEISKWFAQKPFKVVANLPYYISSPIIFYLIESGLKIESLTIMLQKELAERLCAKQGTKNYGSPSVLLSLVSDVSIKRIVPKTMFKPVPKVDSALLKIDVNFNKFDVDYFKIAPFIRGCFSMKRKTLLNNISGFSNLGKDKIGKIFDFANIDSSKRPEQLSVEEFITLFNSFNKITKALWCFLHKADRKRRKLCGS